MIDALGVGRISKVAEAGGQVRLVVLDQRGFEKKKKNFGRVKCRIDAGDQKTRARQTWEERDMDRTGDHMP